MRVRPRFLHLLALGCLLAAACGTVFAADRSSSLSGIYEGNAPAADAARRVFTLDLDADGTAIFTTQFLGKQKASEHGRWIQSGSQVVLSFDPMGANRPPRPITFRHRGHKLSPIGWDPSEWGNAGPPVFYSSRKQDF